MNDPIELIERLKAILQEGGEPAGRLQAALVSELLQQFKRMLSV